MRRRQVDGDRRGSNPRPKARLTWRNEDEMLDDFCLGRGLRCPRSGCCTARNVDRRELRRGRRCGGRRGPEPSRPLGFPDGSAGNAQFRAYVDRLRRRRLWRIAGAGEDRARCPAQYHLDRNNDHMVVASREGDVLFDGLLSAKGDLMCGTVTYHGGETFPMVAQKRPSTYQSQPQAQRAR